MITHRFANKTYSISSKLKLCYVTDRGRNSIEWLVDLVEKVVSGGVTMVQLREKKYLFEEEILNLAQSLKRILKLYNIPLIINDHVKICKDVRAAGVHLGQQDMHPNLARKILGKNAIIGLSVETLDQAYIANSLDSIDYIAASPVFKSHTKLDCRGLWKLEGLIELVKISKHPVMAIGGINFSNIAKIIKAGAIGVAVVSNIQAAGDPALAAKRLVQIINQEIGKNHVRKN